MGSLQERRAGLSLMGWPRCWAGVEHVSSARVRLPFSHLRHREEQRSLKKGANHENQRAGWGGSAAAASWHSLGSGGAVLVQRCQLAVAVPGVSGDGQRLHFVKREVSGQLGEAVVVQVGGFQHGHTSERVVCKLKHKGLW